MTHPLTMPGIGDDPWGETLNNALAHLHNDILAIDTSGMPEVAQDAVAALLAAGTHSGITFTYDDANNRMNVSVTATVATETIQDAAAALLTAGGHSGITFTYDDTGNRITATVAAPTNIPVANITGLTETIQDVVALMFSAGTQSGITFIYNDDTGTLNATVTEVSGEPTPPAAVHKLVTVETGVIQGTSDSFDSINQQNGALTISSATPNFRGTKSIQASMNAGSANAFVRGLLDIQGLSLGVNDDVWYGMALFLPTGFWAKDSWMEILRMDNFDIKGQALADHLGIGLNRTSWGGGLFMQSAQTSNGEVRFTPDPVVSQAQLTEGVWHTLEVHHKLSKVTGTALNEFWFDGASTPTWTNATRNLYDDYPDGSFKYLRAGIVSMLSGTTYQATDLRIDDIWVSGSARRGFP